MIKLLRNIIPAIFFILIILYGITYAENNKWNIEISLSKQSYIVHEPIWLDVTLTNITSDTLRTHGLDAPNHRQFTIELKDNKGKLVEYTGPSYSMIAGPGELVLKAGEQEYRSFNLLELFKSHEDKSGYSLQWLRFPYTPKGTYIVKVYFEGDTSNELTFNIIEPKGEEKEVLELIEQASILWVKDDTDPSAQIYKEIVEKYPNSVFAELCFYLSNINSQKRKDIVKQGKTYHYKPLYIQMLKNYPNSGESEGCFRSITREMDDDEKMETYNKYITEFPNTRCSKYASQMKQRLLKKMGEK